MVKEKYKRKNIKKIKHWSKMLILIVTLKFYFSDQF